MIFIILDETRVTKKEIRIITFYEKGISNSEKEIGYARKKEDRRKKNLRNAEKDLGDTNF